MQPSLAADGIVSAVHSFVEDMGVVATETRHFLFQSPSGLSHQIGVTVLPQFIAMSQRAGDSYAGRLNRVLSQKLSIGRGQLSVPVNNFAFFITRPGAPRYWLV